VRRAAAKAGCPHPAAIETIWGNEFQLREFAERKDWRGFSGLVAAHAAKMDRAVRNGDALLFLQGSQPSLLAGIAPDRIAELRRISWEHFGPIAQQLVLGASNWTVAPAPSAAWANAAYDDLPVSRRLPALWDAVFSALRIPPAHAPRAGPEAILPEGRLTRTSDHLAAWQAHLAGLARRRDDLNGRHLTTLHFVGPGTDLRVALPVEHRWCTAQLTTQSGLPFVANLPTEEVFTAPHKDSASGTVRVTRPVSYGGSLMAGIELEFSRGRVVQASARSGGALLRRLLETDEGAVRLGEVAWVDQQPVWAAARPATEGPANRVEETSSMRLFHHPLLDENASHHIALGEAYGFCLQSPNPAALNRSLVHVDLPLDATVQPA
jgi:aminopeptidase